MPQRMRNPVMVLPGAMEALQTLNTVSERGGVPPRTLGLVHLRASQINGCGVCVDLHPRLLKHLGETDERLFAVAAWRDAPFFTEAERAALALAEAVTRLADSPDPVPDVVWGKVKEHYDEKGLAALILAIATINVWNRLNVTTRQVAGDWATSDEAAAWLERRAAG